MTTPVPAAASLLSLRILAGTLMWSIVILGAAAWFVLIDRGLLPVRPLVVAAQLAAGAVAHLLCETLGYRLPALRRGMSEVELGARARAAYARASMVRFVVCEAIAIGSLAAAFVVRAGGFTLYAVGGLVSLVLLAVHVWPWARPVTRSRAALERDGVPSHLFEGIGVSGHVGREPRGGPFLPT